MILGIFLLSLIITIVCLNKKLFWKKFNEKSPWYFFFDKCVEFFIPLTVVTAFYTVLWVLVEGTSDTTTLGWLESLENFLLSVQDLVAKFKVKPWFAGLFILGFIILDLLLSYFLESSTLASRYKTYHTWSKRVYIIAVLFCSFTFFGNQVGDQIAHLRIRTDKIKQGYAKIQDEAEDILYVSVQQKIYEKVKLSLPPDIRDNIDYPKIINIEMSNLRNNYEKLKLYNAANTSAAEIIKNNDAQIKRNNSAIGERIRYDEPTPDKPNDGKGGKSPRKSPKAQATLESVEKTLANVEAKKSVRTRFISLLKLDGTKELLCQFPKSLTDVAKSRIFKTVVEVYPILEPVVDVFVGTYDKYVESKVKESTNIVAEALLESPEKAEQAAAQEAQKIADSVEVKMNETTITKARKSTGEAKIQIEKLKAVNATVSSSIDSEIRAEQKREIARANAEEDRQLRDKIAEIRKLYSDQRTGDFVCKCYCEQMFLFQTTASSQAECNAICHAGSPC
ncbi:MAG TPA: hypothetical protein VF692_13550 [Pyrinomonadaceae bacterium]